MKKQAVAMLIALSMIFTLLIAMTSCDGADVKNSGDTTDTNIEPNIPPATEKLFNIDGSKIDSLEVRNGSTGKTYNLYKKEEIKNIVNVLNKVEYVKNVTPDERDGWTYSIAFSEEKGDEPTNILFHGGGQLVVNGTNYEIAKTDYYDELSVLIEPIFESVLNISARFISEIKYLDVENGEFFTIDDEEKIAEIIKILNTFDVKDTADVGRLGTYGPATATLLLDDDSGRLYEFNFRDDSSVEINGTTYFGAEGHFKAILDKDF